MAELDYAVLIERLSVEDGGGYLPPCPTCLAACPMARYGLAARNVAHAIAA